MILDISKGQATAIILIIAGIIEVLLLLSLLKNISKKRKNNNQNMNMFDNSQTDQTYVYQEPVAQPTETVFNDELNQDMNAVPSFDFNENMTMNDSYNEDSAFSGENLMNMQMNDTLDIPNTNENIDNPQIENNIDNFNEMSSSFSYGSLENQPDIITDNTDPLPTMDELGNNENEIVEPLDNNMNFENENVNPLEGGSDISYDNGINLDNDTSNINIGLDSQISDIGYDIPTESNSDQFDLPYKEDI